MNFTNPTQFNPNRSLISLSKVNEKSGLIMPTTQLLWNITSSLNLTQNWDLSSLNMSRNSNNDTSEGLNSKFITLCAFWLFIVIGNSLVIFVHRIHRRKHIPDYLILVLASIDLVNAVGPVMISMIMYLIHPNGFLGIANKNLCSFYNTAATMLRLSACFIMTMMALDRALSVQQPVYYRMVLRLTTIRRWTIALIVIAFIIACLPLAGLAKVYAYPTVCSFDFGSAYAVVIAVIGYVQLAIVLVCYVIVVKGLFGFVERQTARRREQYISECNQKIRAKLADRRKSSSGLWMRDMSNFRSGKHFAKMTGLISVLFYISWMPIVLSITVRLITGKYSEALQFISARMSLIGSLSNPIVYALMSRKYRKGYWYCLRRIASLCGAPKPTHPVKGSAIAKMMAQSKIDQAASPIVFPKVGSPYYVTGRKSLHATNNVGLDTVAKKVGFLYPEGNGNNPTTRNEENRTMSISKNTFGVDTIERKVRDVSFPHGITNAALELDDENSSEDEKQRVLYPRFEDVQRGFEGDTEDSDNCNEWLENNGHAAVDKSSSAPTCMRCKRRRIKRKSMSEDLGDNRSRNVDEARINKRRYLQFAKQSLDMTSLRPQYTNTDTKRAAFRGPKEAPYTTSLKAGFPGSDTKQIHRQSTEETLHMTSLRCGFPDTDIKQVHLQVPKRYVDVCYVGDGLWDTDTTDVETDLTPQSSIDDSEGHLASAELERVKFSDDVEL